MIYVVFIIYFVLALTGFNKKIKFKALLYTLVWFPVIIMLYMNFFYNAVWSDYPDGFWYLYLQFGLNGVYIFISIVVLLYWNYSTQLRRIKRQSALVIGGMFFTLLITIIGQLTSDRVNSFTMSPFAALIWVFTFWYAIVKYRMMALTPENIGADILSEINDIVVLTDINGIIIHMNNRVKELLNIDIHERQSLVSIVSENDTIERIFQEISECNDFSGSYRLNFISHDNRKVLMDVSLKTYRDRFGDIIGVICIGREVQGIDKFQTNYRLTHHRELEIIQHILTGLKQHKIAVLLGITENTLKRHITNIHNKVGISSKYELLNVLNLFEKI
jgi:DNA-binding CsgD family transcriptional regulator/PAS domain-containing protein